MRIDREASLTVAIYDVAGRLVRRLYSARALMGHFRFVWDGSLARGRIAPAGGYFLRVEAAGVARSAKIVKLE